VSQSGDQSLTPDERLFLATLENIECRKIAMGDYNSFTEIDSVNELLDIEKSRGLDLAHNLEHAGLLLIDRSTGTDLVISRTAHIIKTLSNSTMRGRIQKPVHNISDVKYLRFTKQTPRPSIPLLDEKINKLIMIDLLVDQGLSKDIVDACIKAVSSQYSKLSTFQLSSTRTLLQLLTQKEFGRSLSIVADQFPLIIWIINKKIKAYLAAKNHGDAKFNVNCSALLIFPRNVLAKDQFDDLSSLCSIVNEKLRTLNLPNDLADFLQIKIRRDFAKVGLEERTSIYKSFPDVIVTNGDTLKRRLMNPLCTSLYAKGVDLVLYDEVHLYYGLFGANIASLNSRLQNILPYVPVFVGMSATIANPEKHCMKLFALQELPVIITDREEILSDYSLEHHVILKPKLGRSSLGVCIDSTSCLLHNRRNDMLTVHSMMSNETRPKTLCFVDSLDIAGRWRYDQKDYENFDVFQTVSKPRDGYAVHFTPWATSDPSQINTCSDCKSRKDVVAALCSYYQLGQCWWFSQDSANLLRWETLPTGEFTPRDNIRTERLTSQEIDFSELDDIYSLFISKDPKLPNVPLDALIATSVLEVGVDFRRVKEVVMFGEIRSPVSYKQKAGRGAREGNLFDGLFIMTVIPPSPLASFYYRHFHRLVFPSLAPLPLEPRNPDVIRSHAFCSIFDLIAKEGINVFNVIRANSEPLEVEKDFDSAIDFIKTRRDKVASYVINYLVLLGENRGKASEIADASINEAIWALKCLSRDYSIGSDKRKIVTWVFEAFRDSDIMLRLEEDFEEHLEKLGSQVRQLIDSIAQIRSCIIQISDSLSTLGPGYEQEREQLLQKLKKLESTL
jgi:DEAD/DEAH box helicase domain-containing protein